MLKKALGRKTSQDKDGRVYSDNEVGGVPRAEARAVGWGCGGVGAHKPLTGLPAVWQGCVAFFLEACGEVHLARELLSQAWTLEAVLCTSQVPT
jgi:hypothetical protein